MCTVTVEDSAMLDDMASHQEPRTVVLQAATPDEPPNENTNIELYIRGKVVGQSKCHFLITLTSDLRLECAKETSDFPLLNSVKVIIFGSNHKEGRALLLEKESATTWSQSSPAEL